MWNSKPTLSTRLSKTILFLTSGLTILFTLITLFIAYSLEDAMFNQQLKQAHVMLDRGEKLPNNIQLKPDLNTFNLSPAQQHKYGEFSDPNKYGEFTSNGRHYHYKTTSQGVLLVDTTDLSVVSRGLPDILLFMLFVMLVSLAISVWVAKKTSAHALKPFNQLKSIFLSDQHGVEEFRFLLNNIDEQDIKLIAEEIIQALEEKTELLEQQIAFNQGMSHELRTPLQVMTHSLELLSSKFNEIGSQASYKRVLKSVDRMQRISNGLLWLTSNENPNLNTKVNETVKHVLVGSEDLTNVHNIQVEIRENAELQLPLPSIVFELIVMNLLNNVIHHALEENGQRFWQIAISENAIIFSNHAEPQEHKDIDRFGLGLILVTKLCNKFGLITKNKNTEQTFSIEIGVQAEK